MIQDSGTRRNFKTGAVRDVEVGKGRCDLMPLDVVARIMENDIVIGNIYQYVCTDNDTYLYRALDRFLSNEECPFKSRSDMMLEVSKHFEEGALKYGENNWQKGIPESSYIDSAVRHYLKWQRGDEDERHDRAFVWNIMCLIWTHDHITEEEVEENEGY